MAMGGRGTRAFDALKKRVTTEPVLAHTKLDKQFKMEVDASGYVVCYVAMERWS